MKVSISTDIAVQFRAILAVLAVICAVGMTGCARAVRTRLLVDSANFAQQNDWVPHAH